MMMAGSSSSSRSRRRRQERLSSTLLLVLALLALGVSSAVAAPATLWEAIRSNSSFTVLADCVRLADDPALMVRAFDACGLILTYQW